MKMHIEKHSLSIIDFISLLRKRISATTCYINLPVNYYFSRYIFIFSCLKHLALQHTFLESSHTIVDIIHKVVEMCYNYVAMS